MPTRCDFASIRLKSMRAPIIHVLLVLGIFELIQAQETWQWRNGFPQGHDLHGVHFIDAATGWAVGVGGTILHTADSGKTWSIVKSSAKTGLTSLHFPAPDTGYVAGWDGLVLKTENAGKTWSQCSTSTDKNLWDIHFVNSKVGYAVGDEGTVIKTENGGATWKALSIDSPNSFLTIRFISEDTGYVAGGGGIILKTKNAGVDWSVMHASGDGDIRCLRFSDANLGFAVGSIGVLRTRDGGATWDTLWREGAILESIAFPTPEGIHAVGISGTAIRSMDGGIHWESQKADSGSNLVRGFMTHWDLFDLHFPDSRNGYAVGRHGVIAVTRDGGASWSPLSRSASTVQMNGVTFINRDTGFVTGTLGLTLRTEDGGNTWVPESPETNSDMHVIQFPSPRIGYVVGHFGELWKTIDGGKTWKCQLGDLSNTKCLDDLIDTDFNGVHFPEDVDTGYAVASGGHIIKTMNGGLKWALQNSGTDQRLMYVQCLDNRTCIAVGDFGTLLKTTDGGMQWTQRNGCRNQNLNAVHFPVRDTGYIVGTKGTVCKSEDGGETWSPRSSGTEAELRAVRFFNTRFGYAVGTGGTILSTRDGGDSWQSHESGTFIDLQTVYVTEKSAIIAGTAGVILKADWGNSNAIKQKLHHTKSPRSIQKGVTRIFQWDKGSGRWVDAKGRKVRQPTSAPTALR